MVKIFGKEYFIDIDGLSESCKVDNPSYDEFGKEVTEINIFKYEILKMCLERVLNEGDYVDEEMGEFSQKETTISFRLAFNTLQNYDILRIDDNIDESF